MNILITGGSGSLGTVLISKLIESRSFDRICIYSRDEHKQENIRTKFDNNKKLRFFIGDIRDKDRLNIAFKNINLVVHAAALKVVPLLEYNPIEAIKTNILGAQNVIECALSNLHSGIWPKVLAISTDKAVHPINLYGATKLCAEKLFTSANNIMGPQGPRFSIARYGNVANSNGSVIPLFQKQIANNEQLTLTDDKMTRFWITLDEAADFVMSCLDRMHGGETFVPHMPSFSVKDLALTMMSKYPAEKQFCRVIGIRPGEKIHEEIITNEEAQNTVFDKYGNTYVINPSTQIKREYVVENIFEGINSSQTSTLMYHSEIANKLEEINVL